jgi:hypothetical protein
VKAKDLSLLPRHSVGDGCNTSTAALLVPELMKGFIEQSALWEREYGGKAGKKGATFIAAVQFRLWSSLVWPMVVGLCKFVLHRIGAQLCYGASTHGSFDEKRR